MKYRNTTERDLIVLGKLVVAGAVGEFGQKIENPNFEPVEDQTVQQSPTKLEGVAAPSSEAVAPPQPVLPDAGETAERTT